MLTLYTATLLLRQFLTVSTLYWVCDNGRSLHALIMQHFTVSKVAVNCHEVMLSQRIVCRSKVLAERRHDHYFIILVLIEHLDIK